MNKEDLKNRITELVNQKLEGTELFLVEIKILPQTVQVFMDGDRKVSINDCVEINRFLEKMLNAEMPFSDQFGMEVSSAGMSEPFKLLRQYKNKIGKEVNVVLANGQKINGTLQQVEEQKISLLKSRPKNEKNAEQPIVEIPFSEIKKTTLEIKF